MTYAVEHSGHCPELNREMTISVTVEERQLLGDKAPQHAKRSFSCPYGSDNGCKTEDSSGCPVYNEFMPA